MRPPGCPSCLQSSQCWRTPRIRPTRTRAPSLSTRVRTIFSTSLRRIEVRWGVPCTSIRYRACVRVCLCVRVYVCVCVCVCMLLCIRTTATDVSTLWLTLGHGVFLRCRNAPGPPQCCWLEVRPWRATRTAVSSHTKTGFAAAAHSRCRGVGECPSNICTHVNHR